jgi:hypothetical protein
LLRRCGAWAWWWKTAGRIAQSAASHDWINRALDGLFIYLGIRIVLFQANSW